MAIVLGYHHVGARACDVHDQAVPETAFRAQLEHLREHYEVVSVPELVERVARGDRSPRSVALTFDDGYRDMLEVAAPTLRELDLPAAFFVTTRRLEAPHPFWWDVLEQVLLGERPPPSQLVVTAGGGARRLDTADASGRRAAHDALHALLLPAGEELIDAVVDLLLDWSGVPRTSLESPMSVDEVRALAGDHRFTIGSHGVGHLLLPCQPAFVMRAEVVSSKAMLELALGRPIDGFCYPFGAHDDATVAAVEDAGYRYAFTTLDGPIAPCAQRLRLPRRLVPGRLVGFADWLLAACADDR